MSQLTHRMRALESLELARSVATENGGWVVYFCVTLDQRQVGDLISLEGREEGKEGEGTSRACCARNLCTPKCTRRARIHPVVSTTSR